MRKPKQPVMKVAMRLAIVLLVAIILTDAISIRGPSHHQQQTQSGEAQAQEEVGLLALFIESTWPYLQSLIYAYGFLSAIQWAWNNVLAPIFSGRPDIGPGSATWCDAEFFGYSRNGFVKNLGTTFVILQRQGHSLSSGWWLFTDKANKLCTDLENRCGYSTGLLLCQSYCAIAANFANSCSNWVAIAKLNQLDNAYRQCF